MDNYIVRIYRRHPEDPAAIEGLVEVVQAGRSLPFRHAQELWTILQGDQLDEVARGKANTGNVDV